jgi:uncharacterized membrane protein
MRLPLLVLHITGGMIGLLSGAIAMIYRKGSRGHRVAGNVFVVSMVAMGACAAVLAARIHQTDNFFGGLLTLYMLTTAWLTGRRRSGDTGIFDWGAFIFGAAIAATMTTRAILVAVGVIARQPGVPLVMYFFGSTIILLAAAGDLRMLVRGGISGTPRIARHLWRMCYGWFIATGSFFLGKQEFFPASWRGSPLFLVPALLPLALLIFWLGRVLFTGTYKKQPPASVGGVVSMRA